MRRRAIGVARRHRRDRAPAFAGGGVGPGEQVDLAALLDRLGQLYPGLDRVRSGGAQRDRVRAPTTASGRARRGIGRLEQTLGREIGGVGEARGVAAHDAQARATVVTGDELFDAPVVETGVRRAPVFDEDFGEVAAAAQRLVERGLQHTVIDQGSSHMSLVYTVE